MVMAMILWDIYTYQAITRIVQFYLMKLSVFSIGWLFSLCLPVSRTNKTDRHDLIEIMLKVTLNTNFLNLILVCSGVNV